MEQGHNWKAAKWTSMVMTSQYKTCAFVSSYKRLLFSADQLTNIKHEDAVLSGGGGGVGTSSTRYWPLKVFIINKHW